MSQIPNIFFKEEQLEEIYTKKESIKVPTNQTQYTFDTKDNLESFIKNQFPTDEEYANYKEYTDFALNCKADILGAHLELKGFDMMAGMPNPHGMNADIFSRFMRLTGNDVAYICGSDEHGVPITIKAKKEGLTPKDIIDRYHSNIKKSFEDFGISFDNYSRTSSELHHKTASDF